MPQIFRIGPYLIYFRADEVVKIIEARHNEILSKWKDFFGKITYYC